MICRNTAMVSPHKLHIVLFLRLSRDSRLAMLALLAGLLLLVDDGSAFWRPSTFSTLLYVGSFATHFGTQIWMTFVSGIVLFFKLPRELFGLVQRHLFPKYFLLNSTLGFITLLTFVAHHPTLDYEFALQRWALAVCFLCDLLAALYIVPDMVDTLRQRSDMEAAAAADQLLRCPQYVRLRSRFRRGHGACALVNMVAVSCNGLHLYHLAWRLSGTLT